MPEQQHRHAAIMFTDIVGYTSTMGMDEAQALEMLRRNRDIHISCLAHYKGVLIKEMGDGMLLSFELASDAVRCAVEIQKACSQQGIPLKIGIHEGEVVFEGGDVLGAGVNVASRLQDDASEGSIIISGVVYSDVKNKHGIVTEYIDEKAFKNVDEKIKVYQVLYDGSARDIKPVKNLKAKASTKKSIVVLPFVNMSPDTEQEFFSDGLTEEIITDLSYIHDLIVISRNSSMTFKNSGLTTRKIAEKVNVRYVLEGSVRKAGNNIRIVAQLIEASTDTHLWAEKYNGTLDDVFDIQEKVSKSIVNALKIKLNQKELMKLTEYPISSPQAYELYQKAQFEFYRFKEDGLNRALQYLNSALNIEGDNAFLYSKIGIVYCILLNVSNKLDRSYIENARHFAAKVFELEPDNYRGHIIHGWITFYDGNIEDLVRHLKKAYKANPNDSDILFLLILGNFYLGLSNETERLITKMGEVDPLNPIYYPLLSLFYYSKGDLHNALEQIKIGYKIYPEIPQIQLYYSYFLAYHQDIKEANRILDLYISATSGSIFSTIGVLFKCALNRTNPKNIITDEIENKLKIDCEWSWLIADFLALMGKNEEALEWLEHAVNKGFINYPLLSKYDIFLKNIRNEERFMKLMERVKPAWENFEKHLIE